MGGVSGPKTVPGAGGYGKVVLKFSKISDKKKSRFGAWLFLFGLCLLVFKTLWGWPSIRRDYMVPAVRGIVAATDTVRLRMYSWFSKDVIFAVPSWGGQDQIRTQMSYVGGGVAAKVDIHRDIQSGYIQINASSLSDAVYAQGYIHATDRLGQMDNQRRKAKGLMSEVYGKQHVEADRWHRTLGLHDLAKDDWQLLQNNAAKAAKPNTIDETAFLDAQRKSAAEQVAILQAYSRGVNAAMKSSKAGHAFSLHFFSYIGSWWTALWGWKSQEVELWHPIDTLVLLRLQGYLWSSGFEQEVTVALMTKAWGPDSTDYLYDIGQPVDALPSANTVLRSVSGNVWAAKPTSTRGEGDNSDRIKKTDAILVSDIPALCEQQCPWYMNTLHWSETKIDYDSNNKVSKVSRKLSGSSQPGIPLVMHGSTGMASWGLAVSDVDQEDVYIETIRKSLVGEEAANTESTKTERGADAGADAGAESGEETRAEPYRIDPLSLNMEILQKEQWHSPVSIRIEQIPVAPTTPGEKETYFVPHRVIVTTHGPVVGNLTESRVPQKFRRSNQNATVESGYNDISLCSQALRQPSDIRWLLSLARAEDASHFAEAATNMKTASLHIVFTMITPSPPPGAGAEWPDMPSIGYTQSGETIKRHIDHYSLKVVTRTDGMFDWIENEKNCSDAGSPHKLATVTSSPVLAVESRLRDRHAPVILKNILSWANEPTETGAAELFEDIHSPYSLKLRDMILIAPSLAPEAILAIPDLEQRRRLTQGIAILTNFNGNYSSSSVGPVMLEVIAELLMGHFVDKAEPLLRLMRGGPLSPSRRDHGISATLPCSSWLLTLMDPLRNPDIYVPGTEEIPCLYPSAENIDKFISDSVLKAVLWIESSLGVNKNYRNTKWQWGYIHRSYGPHPARYHSIIHNVLSAPQTSRVGTKETLDGTPTAFSDIPLGSSLLDEPESIGFYTFGYVSAVRLMGHVGGALKGAIAFGQSEHLGSPWGGGVRTVHDWSPLSDTNGDSASSSTEGDLDLSSAAHTKSSLSLLPSKSDTQTQKATKKQPIKTPKGKSSDEGMEHEL